MEKERRNRYSCGSFFVDNCNCERVPENFIRPQHLHSNSKMAETKIFSQGFEGNSLKLEQNVTKMPITTRKQLRSFSHPAINFIFTSETRDLCFGRKETETENRKSIVNCKNGDRDLNPQMLEYSKAQQYFAESGILGPNNLSSSRNYIRKTSRIHLDLSLKSNIRKTSLCLLSRNFGEKCAPTPKTILKDSNDLIVQNIQMEVYSLKDIIGTGETKIIMLRAEVNKIKRVLQELMYANSQNKSKINLENRNVCVFCHQEESGISQILQR